MRLYMQVYTGQSRSPGWIHLLQSYGFGEMCVREELPPRRHPWAFDNGAFRDWQLENERAKMESRPYSESHFRADKYEKALEALWRCNGTPDFIAVPDIVAAGTASLRFSMDWVPRLTRFNAPLYLVVQDGMDERIGPELAPFEGLFVGGSPKWKIRTAAQWVDFAHERGMRCHVGRAGTEKKLRWALHIGADSIDSALPNMSEDNLRRFLRGFEPQGNGELFERKGAA